MNALIICTIAMILVAAVPSDAQLGRQGGRWFGDDGLFDDGPFDGGHFDDGPFDDGFGFGRRVGGFGGGGMGMAGFGTVGGARAVRGGVIVGGGAIGMSPALYFIGIKSSIRLLINVLGRK